MVPEGVVLAILNPGVEADFRKVPSLPFTDCAAQRRRIVVRIRVAKSVAGGVVKQAPKMK
jgi:hypothetical protein